MFPLSAFLCSLCFAGLPGTAIDVVYASQEECRNLSAQMDELSKRAQKEAQERNQLQAASERSKHDQQMIQQVCECWRI